MLFRSLWIKLGVQPDQLEIILLAKLKMDGRRTSMFTQNYKGKANHNLDLFSMAYFFFMGAMCLLIFANFNNRTTEIGLYLSIWLFLLSLTLITEFSEVLIDVRDNYILLPRPVNDQTISISRLVHIFIYLFRLVASFMIPAFIFIIVKEGFPGNFVFLFQMLATVVFAIFLVNMVYLVILSYTTQQRFKEIINYFQIAFIIILLSTYYVLPNIIDFEAFKNANILDHPISYFLPSLWIGSWWELIVNGNTSSHIIILSILGLLTPIICLWLVVNVFSKNLSQKLFSIGQNSSVDKKNKKVVVQKSSSSGWMNWWREKINRTPVEKAGFNIVWWVTARSRDFKLKTYPMFGFIPSYFVFMAMNGKGTIDERWSEILNGHHYIFLIYLAVYGAIIPITNLRFSENFKAAWIFYAMPMERPGEFIKGAVKSIIVKFVLPILVILSTIILLVWGIKALDDILLGTINIFLFVAIVGRFLLKSMPFSRPWSEQSKGNNISFTFTSMFLLGIVGFFHYFFLDQPFLLIGQGIIAIVLIWYFFKSIEEKTYEDLKMS